MDTCAYEVCRAIGRTTDKLQGSLLLAAGGLLAGLTRRHRLLGDVFRMDWCKPR